MDRGGGNFGDRPLDLDRSLRGCRLIAKGPCGCGTWGDNVRAARANNRAKTWKLIVTGVALGGLYRRRCPEPTRMKEGPSVGNTDSPNRAVSKQAEGVEDHSWEGTAGDHVLSGRSAADPHRMQVSLPYFNLEASNQQPREAKSRWQRLTGCRSDPPPLYQTCFSSPSGTSGAPTPQSVLEFSTSHRHWPRLFSTSKGEGTTKDRR